MQKEAISTLFLEKYFYKLLLYHKQKMFKKKKISILKSSSSKSVTYKNFIFSERYVSYEKPLRQIHFLRKFLLFEENFCLGDDSVSSLSLEKFSSTRAFRFIAPRFFKKYHGKNHWRNESAK